MTESNGNPLLMLLQFSFRGGEPTEVVESPIIITVSMVLHSPIRKPRNTQRHLVERFVTRLGLDGH